MYVSFAHMLFELCQTAVSHNFHYRPSAKLRSIIISSFSVEFDDEGPRSEFELERIDKQTAKNMGRVIVGTYVVPPHHHVLKITLAIRKVRDQPKSLCRQLAIVNLTHPVEFKSIPQPRVLDAWHP